MDQIKTGKLIRVLRQHMHLTQLELAEKVGVSDKAVSKWERGCGSPDISYLPVLADVLKVDARSLLRGDLEENDMTNGDLKKMRFYVCPDCANIVFSTDSTNVNCCGKKLDSLEAAEASGNDRLDVTESDGEWYVTSAHEMTREHYVSFVAFLTGDTVVVKRLHPEWNMEVRLPFFAHGTILWYCTQHGLFFQNV